MPCGSVRDACPLQACRTAWARRGNAPTWSGAQAASGGDVAPSSRLPGPPLRGLDTSVVPSDAHLLFRVTYMSCLLQPL